MINKVQIMYGFSIKLIIALWPKSQMYAKNLFYCYQTIWLLAWMQF